MGNTPHRILRPTTLPCTCLVLLFLVVAGPPLDADLPAEAPVSSPDIGVRSSVDERWDGFRKRGAIPHGKIYLLAAINEVPSVRKMVKPLNEGRLLQLLRAELGPRGFTEITPAQKPDVVLTILYGRGWLRNPYLQGTMLDEDSDFLPVATLLLPDQLFRQREAGYEAKLQAAQQEKLFIRVTAWKYPETPAEKPVALWKTTMVVDDPDHRDLNQVSGKMLAAGAGYFDRQIKAEEVRVNTPLPPGRVILGPMNILEPDTPGK